MGYKLAGFRVLGGVDIDPDMMALYRDNHKPQHSYLMGVAEFAAIPDADLPAELFDLDVLDGSPPCSSFSMSGAREKKWGKASKFREGQATQVLDDLFFHFIDVAAKLRPKVVVAENVKGLIIGKARGYVQQIFRRFREAGYEPQLFLLNAAAMGVPQRRERTFFIARRADLALPKISLDFRGAEIPVKDALRGVSANGAWMLTPETRALWEKIDLGRSLSDVHPRGSGFSKIKIDPDRSSSTVTAQSRNDLMHWSEPRCFSGPEIVRLQSFPDDYRFGKESPHYVCGMSVPPLMMRAVAHEVRSQILDRRS